MKIFTHIAVDLDAVCSVWAARQFIPGANEGIIMFRPANWDGSDMEQNDLALDIDAGGRGIKGEKEENGIIHSCFAQVVKKYASPADQFALASLVKFVDAQDSYGSAVKFLIPQANRETQKIIAQTGLNAVLRALQTIYQNDAVVCEKMSEILSGILQMGRSRQRAVAEADKAEIIDGGKVAIVVNSKELATNAILFEERNIKVIVYVDGNNIGIIRHGKESLRMDHPALRKVVKDAGEQNEWFAHPAGFLFCRGSRKAPARNPSRVNPWKLAQVAAKLLK